VIGTFLEFGFSAQPLGEAFEFYRGLGFQSVPIGDILDYPYAVVSDGDICIGLHERNLGGPSLTFVRPDLSAYSRALRRRPIELEFAHLTEDEFNEVAFRDPNGQLVTLMEARTFSPGSWEGHGHSACGEFLEFSLPTASMSDSESYWQSFGFTTVGQDDKPHPWIRLSGHGVSLGFHQTSHFASGMTYKASTLGPRLEYMRAKGFDPLHGSPMEEPNAESATLIGPGGMPIYLLDGGVVAAGTD